jgi:hypothetical protein
MGMPKSGARSDDMAPPWPTTQQPSTASPPHNTPQGLFHPARKVREVYWRLYNNVYIGAQDALVALYPRMADEGINSYHRHELDVFV